MEKKQHLANNSHKTPDNPRKHLDVAARFFKYGNDILSTTMKISAENVSAPDYCKRARVYSLLGRHEDAVEDYKKAVRMEPLNLSHYLNLAYSQIRLGSPDEARLTLVISTSIDQNNHLPFLMLGRLERDIGNYSSIIYSRHYYHEAITRYESSPNLNKDRLSHMLFEYADISTLMSDHSESIRAYSRIISMFPNNENAYERRGLCNLKLGNNAKAIKDFEKGRELNPNNPNILVNLGIALICINKYPEAIESLSKALKINGDHLGFALLNRSAANASLGKYGIALADLKNAATIDPDLALLAAEQQSAILQKISEN